MKDEYSDGFFNISPRYGFLPMKTTINLSEEFEPLLKLCNELPILKKDGRFGILY